jgi:hypothetical protein
MAEEFPKLTTASQSTPRRNPRRVAIRAASQSTPRRNRGYAGWPAIHARIELSLSQIGVHFPALVGAVA